MEQTIDTLNWTNLVTKLKAILNELSVTTEGITDATQINATAVGTGTATNVQGILVELEARITALESA